MNIEDHIKLQVIDSIEKMVLDREEAKAKCKAINNNRLFYYHHIAVLYLNKIRSKIEELEM